MALQRQALPKLAWVERARASTRLFAEVDEQKDEVSRALVCWTAPPLVTVCSCRGIAVSSLPGGV